MSKRRLMITGSDGFVGKHIIQQITGDDDGTFELIDFCDPQTRLRPDIRDEGALGRTIASGKPDVLIHLAAIAAPREAQKSPSVAWAVNVLGTLNVAQSILAHSPETRLIWAGSSEAYGVSFNEHELPIRENVALEPVNAYGATKAASDIMLRQMAESGLQVVIFRPFNPTGPGQTTDYVVPAFASQIAKIEAGLQEPVIHVGNLEAQRDFLDVRDVVNAYLAAAKSREIYPGRRYNISTGKPISIKFVLDSLLKMSPIDIAVRIDSERYAKNQVPIASGSNDAMMTDFGWMPTIGIEATLGSVLASFRKTKD